MYQVALPAPALAPYIESYWCVYATEHAPLDLSVEVFVDVRPDLIFTFGAAYERSQLDGESLTIDYSNLDAQRLHPIRIAQRGHVVCCGVRFHVGGLAPFVDRPVHLWNDRVVGLSEVFGASANGLCEALRSSKENVQLQKEIFDAFLLQRLRVKDGYQVFQTLRAEIEASKGEQSIDAVCRRNAISQRQLNRLFRAYLGFSPKTYSRVVRFQRALKLLKQDPGCTLAEVAAQCGYYDQPHFVREFKAYAGTAPKLRLGYYPADAPTDFSPNLVQFVQDRPGE